MPRSLHDLTSNQYWGGLNRRFERRARRLLALGFTFEADEDRRVAFFVRRRAIRHVASIPAATLHHADARAWIETLQSALRA